jgi:hypothetical protein
MVKFQLVFHSILFLILVSLQSLIAQTSTLSPYSRYGIGELQYNGFSQNLGKGGIAYGISNQTSINFLNPASYAALDSLAAFEAGVNSKFSWFRSADDTAIVNRTALGHIALGFPFPGIKRWGMSLGLLPYSSIGYKLVYKSLSPTGDSVTYQYDGSGGMNMLYFGNGFKLHKNFSIGLNVCYLFGLMTNSSAVLFTTGENNVNLVADKIVNVSDVLLNGGFQFKFPIKKRYTCILGGVYTNTTDVHAIKNIITTRFTASTGSIIDTIIQDSSTSGNFTIPQRIGLGFTFSKNNHWLLGADFSWQQWSAYSSPFDQFDVLTNTINVAVGAEYMRNSTGSSTYFNKVRYRGGLNYGNLPIQINGDKVHQFGLSYGMGFPVIKLKSLLNFGIELGYIYSPDAAAINEYYGKLSIGFTLNEKWFDVRKID